MSKKILALLLIILALFGGLTSCSATVLGKWKVVEISAGEVVMNQGDISDMGMDVGFIKINKSGSCVISILGDEFEGTWEGSKDTQIVFSYGNGMTATATFEGNNMTYVDAQGTVYKLKK